MILLAHELPIKCPSCGKGQIDEWNSLKHIAFTAGISMHCECGMRYQCVDVVRAERGNAPANYSNDGDPR